MRNESLSSWHKPCGTFLTCFSVFPAYYGPKERFTNISSPLNAPRAPSISAYHPNHTGKKEAIFWAARRERKGREREGEGFSLRQASSPLARLREARHAPQRKSLSLIVQTKSETTAAPSISLSWHDVWWYSRVWLHMPSFVLCCVWKWKTEKGGEEEEEEEGWWRVLKALSFSSCLLKFTALVNHHRCCF